MGSLQAETGYGTICPASEGEERGRNNAAEISQQPWTPEHRWCKTSKGHRMANQFSFRNNVTFSLNARPSERCNVTYVNAQNGTYASENNVQFLIQRILLQRRDDIPRGDRRLMELKRQN